jgi:hypothetical protein
MYAWALEFSRKLVSSEFVMASACALLYENSITLSRGLDLCMAWALAWRFLQTTEARRNPFELGERMDLIVLICRKAGTLPS